MLSRAWNNHVCQYKITRHVKFCKWTHKILSVQKQTYWWQRKQRKKIISTKIWGSKVLSSITHCQHLQPLLQDLGLMWCACMVLGYSIWNPYSPCGRVTISLIRGMWFFKWIDLLSISWFMTLSRKLLTVYEMVSCMQ